MRVAVGDRPALITRVFGPAIALAAAHVARQTGRVAQCLLTVSDTCL
jgi:hypothetical protein